VASINKINHLRLVLEASCEPQQAACQPCGKGISGQAS